MMTDQTNQQPSTQQSTPQETNVMAILSLIFAILFPPLGLTFGIIALVQIKNNPNQKGKGLAIAGTIISLVLLLIVISIFILGIIAGYNGVNP